MSDSFWIVLAAFLVALNSSLLGSFLLLRKQAMVSDAISHAVLPGIVIAFMLTKTTHPLVLFVGAASAGIGATFLIGFFEKTLGIRADTAIGITFTTFFALGVVLISMYTQKVDLDQQCVLQGNPLLVPFDLWYYRGYLMGPHSIYVLCLLLLGNILFITLGYRVLYLTSFDPHFAQIMGVRTTFWNYLLMLFTALTTVASFKVVGVILVIAMMVIPAATSYLIAHSLKEMILYTFLLDGWIASLGYLLAQWLNGSMAGAMVAVAGFLFVITLGLSAITRE